MVYVFKQLKIEDEFHYVVLSNRVSQVYVDLFFGLVGIRVPSPANAFFIIRSVPSLANKRDKQHYVSCKISRFRVNLERKRSFFLSSPGYPQEIPLDMSTLH